MKSHSEKFRTQLYQLTDAKINLDTDSQIVPTVYQTKHSDMYCIYFYIECYSEKTLTNDNDLKIERLKENATCYHTKHIICVFHLPL